MFPSHIPVLCADYFGKIIVYKIIVVAAASNSCLQLVLGHAATVGCSRLLKYRQAVSSRMNEPLEPAAEETMPTARRSFSTLQGRAAQITLLASHRLRLMIERQTLPIR